MYRSSWVSLLRSRLKHRVKEKEPRRAFMRRWRWRSKPESAGRTLSCIVSAVKFY